MPEQNKNRQKGALKDWQIEGLNPKVKALHYMLEEKFPDNYRLTSGFRVPEQGVGTDTSRHYQGWAIDIAPDPVVYDYLMNNPEGITALNEAGLGILDETDPRNMSVATGAHFHIGSDFHNVTKKRVEQLEQMGGNLPKNYYFGQQVPDFDYAEFINERDTKGYKKSKDFKPFALNYLARNVYSDFGINTMFPEYDIYSVYEKVTGTSKPSASVEELQKEFAAMPPMEGLNDINHHIAEDMGGVDSAKEYQEVKEQNRLLRQQMEKQQAVEEEKQRKLEEQQEIQALREKENEKLSFLESMLDKPAYVEREQPESQQQSVGGFNPNPVPQQQMDLPNIWDFGEGKQTFQDGGEVVSEYGWDYKKKGNEYFTKRTGDSEWVQPSGEALTAIRQKVFGDDEYTEADRESDFKVNVQKLIDKGRTLEDLVESRVGTKEGLLKMFPELKVDQEAPKNPVSMPTIPSWQEHARTIDRGLRVPEYTETAEDKGQEEKEGWQKPWEDNIRQRVSQESVFSETGEELDPFGRTPKRQPTQEELEGVVKWYTETAEDKGLKEWKTPSNIRFKSWEETDLGYAISELSKEADVAKQWIDRWAVKKGLKEPLDMGTDMVKEYVPNKNEETPDIKGFNKVDVTDSGFMRYQNAFSLSEGQRYLPTANVGKSKDNTKYENVEGIAHFLLDADLTDGYQHDHTKNYVKRQLSSSRPVASPGSTVEVAYIPIYNKEADGTVTLTYKPQTEIKSSIGPIIGPGGTTVRDSYEGTLYNVPSILRQYRFTDLDWEADGTPGGMDNSFAKTIKGLKTKTGETTNLIYPNTKGGKKAYGKFGGGSVVFILPDSGTAVDFAGSIQDIRNKGEELSEKYNVNKEDIIVGFHDIGSFSAKPTANEKGELRFKQWKGFNPRPHTGGGLAIMKQQQ